MAAIAWLVFFTPGTPVSAAERIWRALAAIVAAGDHARAQAARRTGAAARHPAAGAAQATRGRSPAPAPSTLTPDLLAELEIDALTALHARHALAGQRIQVTRTPAGVAVEGLVEGEDRDEIVRALREVPHGAALRVNAVDAGGSDRRAPRRARPRGHRRCAP